MANLDMGTLAAQYGFAAAFFNSDPELKALIQAAVAGQWSNEKFQAKFMNTNWYRGREASVRQWADLTTRDPAEAASKIFDKKLELSDMATQLGLTISDAQLSALATESLKYGMSQQALKDIFGGMVDYTAGNMGGTPAALEMQITKLAGDYGFKPTQGQLTDWISGMVTDRYTEDNLRDFMRDMAKSKYTGMSQFLDQGMTVRQIAAPYMQSYSNLLEVPEDAIALDDQVVQQALQGTPGGPNQPPQMKSVYQFERDLRRDPRWARTKNAREQATSAVMNIGRDWGLVA